MNIPFFSFDHRNENIRTETLKVFESFFDSKWYVLGNFTKRFEELYADFNRTNFCIGVSTGLDALHLSLKALNIGVGDEVIVPSNTYIATVLAISYVGAKPVFVEPRIETCNINPKLLDEKITSNTKCIIPVHLFGQACEMEEIMEVANRNNIFVIEDNAQAHGATYKGKMTGSFGILNATSFYPTKNLGALGEAGAITTDNVELASKIRILRNYGSEVRYFNEVIGFNNRIDEFEAAFLTIALNHIDKWTRERALIAQWYVEALKPIKEINLIKVALGATTVNHLFVIRTTKRDDLREFLSAKGIGTQIHYPIPPHLQKAYSHLGYSMGDFPIAEEIANTCLSLPLWPGMQAEHVEYVSHMISLFFERNG
jgi:dTDP-4-amino-4,6-dideoxygalactose transaminase